MADPKKKIFVITAPIVINTGATSTTFMAQSGAKFLNDQWATFRANYGFVYLCHRGFGDIWALDLFLSDKRHICARIRGNPPDEPQLQFSLGRILSPLGGCVLLMSLGYWEETLPNGDDLRRRMPVNIIDRFAVACRAINAEVEFCFCRKDLATS